MPHLTLPKHKEISNKKALMVIFTYCELISNCGTRNVGHDYRSICTRDVGYKESGAFHETSNPRTLRSFQLFVLLKWSGSFPESGRRESTLYVATSVIKIGHKQSWWQIHTLKTESSDKVLPNKFVNWMTLLALACIYSFCGLWQINYAQLWNASKRNGETNMLIFPSAQLLHT